MEDYIIQNHKNEVLSIVRARHLEDIPFKVFKINLTELNEKQKELFKKLTYRINVWEERPKWIQALNSAQKFLIKAEDNVKKYYNLKDNFPVCFVNLPTVFLQVPIQCLLWKFVSVDGTVIRSREKGMQEVVQEFRCRKCKCSTLIYADRLTRFHFDVPSKCNKPDNSCKGSMYNFKDPSGDENLNFFMNYQEIMIQPHNMQSLLTVELDNELVGTCSLGEIVTICGTLETRSIRNDAQSHKQVLRAVSASVHRQQQKMNMDPDEMNFIVRDEWNCDMEKYEDEQIIRDLMIESVAPELSGLSVIKLGLLLVLCSGGSSNTESKVSTREIAHFLVVGDPGMGKSQLLKAASEIAVISVRTIGYATTTAGLTASYFKEKGETHIEAGALVKANNGVCCIDEINLMSKAHRGSIHEVMESQKVTFAKAGIKGELNTKCSIIAGMNQMNSNLELDDKNFNLEGSLRSRFDLIFELIDPKDPELDIQMISHILKEATNDPVTTSWSLERLQMHILVAKEIRVEMSEAAQLILQRYYSFCTNQDDIDVSRTTLRMLQSLERLTICHAKLMMRTKTKIIDAMTVVMIMESSWSFGRLMTPHNMLRTYTPFGPTSEYSETVLTKLNLVNLKDDLEDEKPKLPRMKASQKLQPIEQISIEDIDKIFSDDSDDDNISRISMEPGKSDQPSSYQFLDQFTHSSFQEKPFDDVPDNELKLEPPLFTSTQVGYSRLDPKNMLPIQKKEETLAAQPIITDPIFSNLNSLAAIFAKRSEQATNVDSTSQVKSGSSIDKLNKYKFTDEVMSSKKIKLSDSKPTTEDQMKPNETSKDEQKIDDLNVDFDPWGDFNFN